MIVKPSYNRAYLASCLQHSTQIMPYGWTSDTLGTLSEINWLYKRDIIWILFQLYL